MMQNNSKGWHYWGRWKTVVLDSSPWTVICQSEIHKKLKLDNIIKHNPINLDGYLYIRKDDLDHLKPIAIVGIQGKNDWFEKFFKICDRETKKMSELEGSNDLNRFIKSFVESISCSVLVHYSDICLMPYLEELCRKEKISFSKLVEAMKPPKPTLLMEYQHDLKNFREKEIEEFLNKYQWVGVLTFTGKPLTKEKLLSELKELKIHHEKPQKFAIPAHMGRIVKIGSLLAFHRSNIIEVATKTSFSFWPMLKELAKKSNLAFEDVTAMSHDEVLTFAKTGRYPNNLRQRRDKFGIIEIAGKMAVITGKTVDKELAKQETKLHQEVKEIRGMSASLGLAKGLVRLIFETKDISKVNDGDIIVAPETTPDYIVAMRKAAAFVTDQGGITSHAAIVAREMNKPCVIGTKIATKVLKDGDMIEVNADMGVVKILK